MAAGQELQCDMAQVAWEIGPVDSTPHAPAEVILGVWHHLTTMQT